ncbi:hypothetical protein PC116_g4872 [Phytophthora cactorum]|uniref:Uncharacterized protein n=1 Tax=Phytophthora cactorum TaxID=29920 RepID=A0A8T1DPW5_9STRA|nr:hypothetical protein PC113_g1962 [Phytophthora cactorum]KAG2942540.1 hypothetical protein PC115_g1386 [Phytophthora cactorum]KAG4063408.1 hypothetical protein PC123_g1758 [Phytophthora cactorum]KAG4247340.1 hypothetical protein PC116_g4872 [Phytophthora cactorum]
MADTPILSSYSRQFALRQPPKSKKPDNFNNKKPVKRPASWKLKHDAASSSQKASMQSRKTLVDAFKQHGMRLCDGARLNAVGKGIHALGRVPPTVSASITALYLSQNNLLSLEGIDQFSAVRLLSVGGNLISSDKEVARLNELAQLRNLNLMGNPLCDQPNYRLRIIALLTKLQVLDNSDITKRERDTAPHVAAQDNALRTMVSQNHFDIQKLQRIAQLILLHKTFYGYVMAGVATGRFDRVPSPNDVVCDVPLLLRLWKYEDALSEQEQEALKVQMLTIIVRTHAKLAENPKVKAKEYLLKLANGSSPRAHRQDGPSSDIRQRCASWEEAYANVIALQQKTIANLHAICEKNRKEMVDYLKELLSMDPRQRNKLVGGRRMEQNADELEMKPLPHQNQTRSWAESRLSERRYSYDSDARSSQHQLPPQQQDPDTWDRATEAVYPSFLPPPPAFMKQPNQRQSPRERKKNRAETSRYSHVQEASAQTTRDRKANLRSGDFANKSLGEAIHGFKLRVSTPAPPQKSSRASLPSKIPQVQSVYIMQRQDDVPLPSELIEKQRPPFHKHSADRQSVAGFQNGSHEVSGSHRDSQVATEFNSSQRRVSSAFTREDLDITSISAISHASSSPPRDRRVHEETYIPIAKSPPNPLAEAPLPPQSVPVQPLQTSQRRQSEPQRVEQLKPVVPLNEGRLQELEQREEKYIRALMQSEQRELDLRNNLSSVQRKLASYQRTLVQQLDEREAIKEEVAQRTKAVATPKILKRFFIRWIRFYNWSQQIKHVQRKRCFIVQHDHFWLWRRKIWMQTELRVCLKKQQLRIRRIHFMEWVNITRLKILRNTYDSAVHEKHELEAHLQAAKDTAVSLSDQIEILHERSKGDNQQVVDLEQALRRCEKINLSLENELKKAKAAIEEERRAWEDALCDEEEKREKDSVKYRSLAQENQVQQVRMIELKRELEAEKAKVTGVEKVNEDLRTASENIANTHHAEVAAAMDKQRELEREIAELRRHLKEQETEREDTANRLQEYEKRIASTCEAMNEHEQAHERENERLRNECTSIEAKWKEEQVKNAELSRLLQRKNQLILNMTHRINHVEPSSHTSPFDPHPGHEQCDAVHGDQEDCGRRDVRMVAQTSCRRHPEGIPGIKPHDNDFDQSQRSTALRSRSVTMNKSTMQSSRRSGHARPANGCSPIETTAKAEEVLIDKHTSKVHEDIRLLQERISKRLEQAPAYAQLPSRLLQRVRPVLSDAPESPISSCSSLSFDGSDTTEENQSVADRVRRARLRRLQTQKQAAIMAVSPAISRLASRAQSSSFKRKEKENVALTANSSKKKTVRKANASKIGGDRSLAKSTEKKKGLRK